jgi:hypothetical protein
MLMRCSPKLHLAVLCIFLASVGSTTIQDIKGDSFLSPLDGKVVYDVTGVVTAKVSPATN